MRQIRILVFASFIIFTVQSLWAQETSPSLDQLKAPTMPAANIIGTQVNEIAKPGNLKDVQAALMNNFMDSTGNVLFPNNYGIEFNPYLLSGMSNFSYNDYIQDNWKKNIWRTFSFSIATNNKFIINDSITTNAIGLGARITLFQGKVSKSLQDAVTEANKDNLSGLKILSFTNSLITNYDRSDSLKSAYTKSHLLGWILTSTQAYYPSPEYKPMVLKIITEIFQKIPSNTTLENIGDVFSDTYIEYIQTTKLKNLQSLLSKVKTERSGFKMDINYAQAFNFPNNSWEQSESSRLGGWINVSYIPAKKITKNTDNKDGVSDFEFLALGRVIYVNQDFVDLYQPVDSDYKVGTNLDAGLRIVYDKDKFSIEGEYIHRWNKKKLSTTIDGVNYFAWEGDNTNKFVLNLNYNVSSDLVVSYNFGKNYDSAFNDGGNLISGLTLNLGFGGYKIADLLKTD